MKRLFTLAAIAIIINTGCAVLFLPKNQKVAVSTNNKESKIFVNDELEGKGTANFKTPKDGMKQVVIQTPGYKDNYCVLTNNKREGGFWACIGFDALFVPAIYGYPAMLFDFNIPKGHAYNKETRFSVTGKVVNKSAEDKYIHIAKIGTDYNKDKDVILYRVVVPKNNSKKIEKLMDDAEAKQQKKDDKANKKLNKKEKEKLKEEEDEVKYDDTKWSENIYKTLVNSGYVDTVNQIFQDENNTLMLDGKITKLKLYAISYAGNSLSDYFKAKLYITWYIKNQYHETLDSIITSELSGDFVLHRATVTYTRTSAYGYTATKSSSGNEDRQIDKMIGDAIDNSYLSLYNNSTFKRYLASEPITAFTDPKLQLSRPQSVVADKSDASVASVIVKRGEKSHGSGFAITQDGYIITNYHVIASVDGKTEKLKVITSTGEELEPKVVRFNKSRDIALLKVDKKFDKAFLLTNNKQFKNLQDVFTIGAPRSIELGQTVTSGMISNERNSNNNELIQLSMSINFGNSGGPVFDNTGLLHGVIVSKLVNDAAEGVCFAIPAYKIGDYINVGY